MSEDHSGQLYRVDTVTGRRTEISFGKPDSGRYESWVVDGKGIARVLTALSGSRARTWYRAGENDPWRKLDEQEALTPGWAPLAIDRDDKTLLVRDQRTRDKAAIVRYDPEAKAFGDVLAAHPQVDLSSIVSDNGEAVGIYYNADRPGFAWFDEELARVHRTVEGAFPGMATSISWSRDRSLFLVAARSDKHQGSYYLYDPKARKMEWLLDRAPWQKPEEHAAMRPVRYKARDGLEIPGYLTLPPGRDKNLPLVVKVHGGPWVDGDSWGYDQETQYLASRGFAVLEPNFRGTTRYGWKHFSSSFGQWGLAMQDDVTDGVKWLIAEGVADPKRVCIYGGSYGGYAAMMALAKEPDMFKCGINYVGVTDLDLLLTATWADTAYSEFVKHTARQMLGDPARDAERLRQTSPVHLAARIRQPVLMAYGGVDFRVPIEHGTRMKAALERAGNTPIWIVADDEGHGFRDPKTRTDFYTTMEKFLKQHLGAP
jgi:dipeptidyl aminopeptidase/acylaminoacyl peptidase